MELSVVVPTWNRRLLLQRTLESLSHQSLEPEHYQIIVVVDGSNDGTLEFLRDYSPHCNLVVISQGNRGQAAARNAGIAAAQGRIVLFIDDDIICDRNLLMNHRTAHRGERERVVFGPTLVHSDTHRTVEAEALRDYVQRRMRSLQISGPRFPDDAMLASNSSAPVSLLRAVGGFDESFIRSIEDIELGYRLWMQGVEFVFCPEAHAYHLYDKDARRLVEIDARQFGRNEVLLSRKHPEHRPYSVLTLLANGPGWKRSAARIASALPFSPDFFLRAIYSVFSALRKFPPARSAAIRLLRIRQGISAIRSAVAFIGSWQEYLQEFQTRGVSSQESATQRC